MVKINIADIRQEYTKGGLRENELPGDPLSLFSRWLQEAKGNLLRVPYC